MKHTDNEKEFIDIIDNYRNVILKVCYMYTDNRDDLADCYQEIVVRLWKGFPGFRGESKISTWIYRVALYTCLSHIRKTKRRPPAVGISLDMGLPSEDDDKQAQTEQLYKAINRLGNIEKALIMLYLDENSYEQIAEITGLSKANVGVKIMRIKNKLKSMLNE